MRLLCFVQSSSGAPRAALVRTWLPPAAEVAEHARYSANNRCDCPSKHCRMSAGFPQADSAFPQTGASDSYRSRPCQRSLS